MPLADKAYKIFVGSDRTLEGSTDADGLVLHKNVPPGDYEMELEGLEERMFVPTTPAHIERRLTRVPGYFLFEDQEGGDAEDPKEEDEDEDTNPLNEPDEEDDDGWELLETFEDNGDDVNDG